MFGCGYKFALSFESLILCRTLLPHFQQNELKEINPCVWGADSEEAYVIFVETVERTVTDRAADFFVHFWSMDLVTSEHLSKNHKRWICEIRQQLVVVRWVTVEGFHCTRLYLMAYWVSK